MNRIWKIITGQIVFSLLLILTVSLFSSLRKEDNSKKWVFAKSPKAYKVKSLPSAKKLPPVVFLLIDEMPTVSIINRKGEINSKRFPNFYKLSQESMWFPNNTTVDDKTYRAVPSILTGNSQRGKDYFPVTRYYPNNLFKIMKKAGYNVQATESATQVCPQSICKLPEEEQLNISDFNNPREFLTAKTRSKKDSERDSILAWSKSLKIKDNSFNFKHVILPHEPYNFLPNGTKYSLAGVPSIYSDISGYIDSPYGNLLFSYQRMMLQTRYIDTIVKNIRQSAIKQKAWNKMVFIVVADHGSSHQKGYIRREADSQNVADLAFSPMWFKYPKSRYKGISYYPTKNIDAYPTLLAQLAIRPGNKTEGRIIKPNKRKLDTNTSKRIFIHNKKFNFRDALKKRNLSIGYRDKLIGSSSDLYKLVKFSSIVNRNINNIANNNIMLEKIKTGKDLTINSDLNSKHPTPIITGNSKELPPNTVLAIGLNNTIRTTAVTFKNGDYVSFAAIINPKYLRSGRRRSKLSFFVIKEKTLQTRPHFSEPLNSFFCWRMCRK